MNSTNRAIKSSHIGMAIDGYMYNKCRTDILRCQSGIVYLVINPLCIIRYRISGKAAAAPLLLGV